MSRGGLYTVAEIARYLGSRPQEVARMIKEDALPALTLPGETRGVVKITLHGLHGWLKAKHGGSEFMSVDELALEIRAANAGAPIDVRAQLMARAAAEAFYDALMGRLKLQHGGAAT